MIVSEQVFYDPIALKIREKGRLPQSAPALLAAAPALIGGAGLLASVFGSRSASREAKRERGIQRKFTERQLKIAERQESRADQQLRRNEAIAEENRERQAPINAAAAKAFREFTASVFQQAGDIVPAGAKAILGRFDAAVKNRRRKSATTQGGGLARARSRTFDLSAIQSRNALFSQFVAQNRESVAANLRTIASFGRDTPIQNLLNPSFAASGAVRSVLGSGAAAAGGAAAGESALSGELLRAGGGFAKDLLDLQAGRAKQEGGNVFTETPVTSGGQPTDLAQDFSLPTAGPALPTLDVQTVSAGGLNTPINPIRSRSPTSTDQRLAITPR